MKRRGVVILILLIASAFTAFTQDVSDTLVVAIDSVVVDSTINSTTSSLPPTFNDRQTYPSRKVLSPKKKFGIYMEYRENYTVLNSGNLATNIIKIYNNTDKLRSFSLLTRPPMGWVLLGAKTRNLTIAAGDSAFIPVRTYSKRPLVGGEPEKIISSLYSDDVLLSSVTWVVERDIIHDWKAFIDKQQKVFLYGEDTSSINVRFVNNGNVNELIQVKFSPTPSLELACENKTHFILPIGRDTTLNIPVKLANEVKTGVEVYGHEDPSFVCYNLAIKAETFDDIYISWNKRASFTETKTDYQADEMKWNHLPLTIDFQTYNILSENPYASMALYGQKKIDDERFVTYDVQMQGSLGQYSNLSSDYQYFSYYSPTLQAELGNVSGSNVIPGGLAFYGKGATVNKYFNENQHRVGAVFSVSPKLFDQNDKINYGVAYSFMPKSQFILLDTYVQNQRNRRYSYDNRLAGLQLRKRFMKRQTLTFKGDISNQSDANAFLNDSIWGYSLRGSYSGRFYKRLSASLAYQMSSKDFVKGGGAQNINAGVTYSVNNKSSLQAKFFDRSYAPNIRVGDVIVSDTLVRSFTFGGLEYNFRKSKYNFRARIDYSDEFRTGHTIKQLETGVKYITPISKQTYFSTSLDVSNFKFDTNPDAYLSLELRMGVRSPNFRFNGVYYYGARYMSEHIEYSQDKIIPRNYYLNAGYDYWLGDEKKFLINSNANINYSSKRDRLSYSFRPTFVYYINSGFKINGYVSLMVLDQGEVEKTIYYNGYYQPQTISESVNTRFETGIGFTKDLGIPTSRRNRYDVDFISFIDMNSNRVKENSESPVPNLLLVINRVKSSDDEDFYEFDEEIEIITDEDGEAVLHNLRVGEYEVEAIPLEETYSWFTERTYHITVLDGNETVYLPQARGGKVYGNVNLEVSRYSRFNSEVDVANIRITATDSTGYSYSTLTNTIGQYELNMPVGTYTLTINEEVFGEAFFLAENNMSITLDNNFSAIQQNFYVKERGRRIDVKRFGQTDNLQQKESLGTSFGSTPSIDRSLQLTDTPSDLLGEEADSNNRQVGQVSSSIGASSDEDTLRTFPNQGAVNLDSDNTVDSTTSGARKGLRATPVESSDGDEQQETIPDDNAASGSSLAPKMDSEDNERSNDVSSEDIVNETESTSEEATSEVELETAKQVLPPANEVRHEYDDDLEQRIIQEIVDSLRKVMDLQEAEELRDREIPEL